MFSNKMVETQWPSPLCSPQAAQNASKCTVDEGEEGGNGTADIKSNNPDLTGGEQNMELRGAPQVPKG